MELDIYDLGDIDATSNRKPSNGQVWKEGGEMIKVRMLDALRPVCDTRAHITTADRASSSVGASPRLQYISEICTRALIHVE